MSDLAQALLKRRRGRAVAAIMGTLERSSAWSKLTRDERMDLRDEVALAVDTYHELALDILKVYSDGTVIVSEQAIEMIRDLHERPA